MPETVDFEAIRIAIASPDEIISWSYGEVTRPETINYRTQRPEREGLFDERIFGPMKDYECFCGKYRKIRFKGIVCDKCGVEVTRASVRRERMGHITLAAPAAHVWYTRGTPSVIGTFLDVTVHDLERVIYFGGYIVLEANETIRETALKDLETEYQEEKRAIAKLPSDLRERRMTELESVWRRTVEDVRSLRPLMVISDTRYHELSLRFGHLIKVGIGAEAIYELLRAINLDSMIRDLSERIAKAQEGERRKLIRRLRMALNFKRAGIRPEWMILTVLPVLPPDLRPMVQLDGGRFATSDLNDLYRRVINRNNRLKKLIVQDAPEVIIRNEKRMLQEAVDCLIDNSALKSKAVMASSGRRKLRSLSDMLRGKQGRFRQNLLGKRVDYSGRSVIVVGPELSLWQCGLPKVMALELFKPFIVSRLLADGHVHNVKNAQRMIERGDPIIFDYLEEISREHPILLNRAPTLHRLGIQAFFPILIEGKAIQIHPLICPAYNADFDGDQMAVHVPLSEQAKREAETLMLSTKNLLKPASGDPIITPTQDMVLGCYWLTSLDPEGKGRGKTFVSFEEAVTAWQHGFVGLRTPIRVRLEASGAAELVETSVGRLLFNEILPTGLGFRNEPVSKKVLAEILTQVFQRLGTEATVEIADKIKDLGFTFATASGLSFSLADVEIPEKKTKILTHAEAKLSEIEEQYGRGLITEGERYAKIVELWTNVRSDVEEAMLEGFSDQNPLLLMVTSGSRGSIAQLVQMAGMKGLVVNPAGEIIELPVISNFKEGLSSFEYFISSHGARKGRSDTALRTSDAGYLTRRLVDVAQDITINQSSCGTRDHIVIRREESEEMGIAFEYRIFSRILAQNVGRYKEGTLITREIAAAIAQDEGVDEVAVYSPLSCASPTGLCQRCFGLDLARGGPIPLGEAVGIIAAQAIGEPGTQLTMRTFHVGGIVGEDITQGLPRVEELFEARTPRNRAVVAAHDGRVRINEEEDRKTIEVVSSEVEEEEIHLGDFRPTVKSGEVVKRGQAVAVAAGKKAKRAAIAGRVSLTRDRIKIVSLEEKKQIAHLPGHAILLVLDGEEVKRGQPLTEGHLDPHELLTLTDRRTVERYLVSEILAIYTSQAQTIHEKYVEVIIRKMFSKVRISDPGDTAWLVGELSDRTEVRLENERLQRLGKRPARFSEVILGITRVALMTDSFLSAASFQETTNVLIDAATRGAVDNLKGLKENVIIGKLIPAGTGFQGEV